jgi:hypothetical protein
VLRDSISTYGRINGKGELSQVAMLYPYFTQQVTSNGILYIEFTTEEMKARD